MRTMPAALVILFVALLPASFCCAEQSLPFDAAYLEVEVPPSDPVVAREGVDGYLQRQIATHAVRIALRDVVAEVVQEKEVKATAWYKNIETKAREQNMNGEAAAMQVLSGSIHVQRVPGTALFWVMVSEKKSADAKVLTSNLIKVYLIRLEREFDDAAVMRRHILLGERDRLDKEVEQFTEEIKKGETENPKPDLTNQRNTIAIDRKRTQVLDDQLDEMRIAISQPNAIGIQVIQAP